MWRVELVALLFLSTASKIDSLDTFECPNNQALVSFSFNRNSNGLPLIDNHRCLPVDPSATDCYMAENCGTHPRAPANKHTYVAGYRLNGAKFETKCCRTTTVRLSGCDEIDVDASKLSGGSMVMRSLKKDRMEICKFKSIDNFKPQCKERRKDSYHSREVQFSSVENGELIIQGEGIIIRPMTQPEKPCPPPPTLPPPDLSQCPPKHSKPHKGGKSKDHSHHGKHAGTVDRKDHSSHKRKSGEIKSRSTVGSPSNKKQQSATPNPLKDRKTRSAERKRSREKGGHHQARYTCPPQTESGKHGGRSGSHERGEKHGRFGREVAEFYRFERGVKHGSHGSHSGEHRGGKHDKKESCPEEKCYKRKQRCPEQKINTTCSAVGDLENGNVTYSHKPTCGQYSRCTVADYKCNECYQLTGTDNSTCLCGGFWYPEKPACKKMCQTIVAPTHGSASSGTDGCSNIGTVITFTCETKYLLSPSISITCNEGGIWSAPVPKCLAPCPPIAPPVNGAQVYSSGVQLDNLYMPNTVSSYSCNQLCFNPSAPSSTCYDGVWTPPSVSCALAGCGPMPDIPDVTKTGGTSPCNPFGTVASLKCNNPEAKISVQSSSCGTNGLWSPTTATCVIEKVTVGCNAFPYSPYGGAKAYSTGSPSDPKFKYGTTAELFCGQPYKDPPVPDSSTCYPTGTWSPATCYL